jgi:hypothetical protein
MATVFPDCDGCLMVIVPAAQGKDKGHLQLRPCATAAGAGNLPLGF